MSLTELAPMPGRREHFADLCQRAILFRAFAWHYRDSVAPAELTAEDIDLAWCALRCHRLPIEQVEDVMHSVCGIVC
jgi:hypothetical protein